jgi:two-component sensor histidine kinase
MKIPEKPHNESERLQNLYGYCILDTEPEDDFDSITTLASEIFDVPVCVITIIDRERQWFKSKVGLQVSETPRSISFCGHAIITPEKLLVVKDARMDDRFKGNPLVVGDPHIVFYAGAPIVSPEGYPFGTICILDYKERELNEQQKGHLKIMARQVSNLLNLRKRNLQLNDALNEKAMLMKEIHHRVKNNLQIISSLLNLQIRSEMGDDATNALESSRDRIMAMSIVHQQLYQNNSLDLVDFDKYLKQLIESMQRVYSNIQMIVHCGPVQLKTDIAVPLSLIVSEVITNACKHGFKTQLNAAITIDVQKSGQNSVILKIRDNGIGFSKQEKWDKSSSLGFEIIKTLTDQINGTVDCESSSDGTIFTFEFLLDEDYLEIKQTA